MNNQKTIYFKENYLVEEMVGGTKAELRNCSHPFSYLLISTII